MKKTVDPQVAKTFETPKQTMASFTLMWMAVLVTELTLYGNASGLLWKSKRTPSQSETGDLGSAENSLVKRPSLRDRGLGHAFGVNLLRRERRQYLQRPVSDQNLQLFKHLSDHGTFNQDTVRQCMCARSQMNRI